MGLSQQRKGYRRERQVVLKLKEQGLEARRQPLSGALGGDLSGDVICEDIKLEIKGRAEPPKVLEGWLGNNDGLVIIPDRLKWRVYMDFELFCQMMQARKQLAELRKTGNGNNEAS